MLPPPAPLEGLSSFNTPAITAMQTQAKTFTLPAAIFQINDIL
jgi:hypothetical protein